jgi:hypothetical protein
MGKPIDSRTANIRPRIRPTRGQQRSGYVLIMTLVLIVLAALCEVGLVRRSLQLATRAIQTQASLQHRWAAASCRKLLLDRAEDLLKPIEGPDPTWPTPKRLQFEFTLAGSTYQVFLSDEDAKANLNTLHERLPAKAFQLATALAGQEYPLQWRPDRSKRARQTRKWFASWGQVFDLASIWHSGDLPSLYRSTEKITCWGDGRLNIRTASDRVLQTLVGEIVGQDVAHKLIEARAEAVDLELPALLKSLALRGTKLRKLRGLLTDRSSCYSLWLALDNGQRRCYHLWIRGDRTAAGPLLAFHW